MRDRRSLRQGKETLEGQSLRADPTMAPDRISLRGIAVAVIHSGGVPATMSLSFTAVGA
jgi:hypothetical protein